MGKKQQIGKDIISRKGGLIATKKDSEEFEKFREEQEEQRQEKRAREAEKLEGREIKSQMPEEQPSAEELTRAKAEEMAEMEKAKERGLLDEHPEELPVNVKKHRRRRPRN